MIKTTALAATFTLLNFFAVSHCAAETQIPIGVSTPLTGSVASWGQELQKMYNFANKVISNNKYKLIFEDDKCDGKTAVTVAHKLISVDNVKYMLGGDCSGVVLAAAPVYEQNKVLFIASGAASPDISKAGDYIFRTWPSDAKAIKLVSDYILQKGYKHLGIISEETAYALGYSNGVKATLESKGMTVAFKSFLPETTDFRPIIQELRSEKIDVLLVSPQAEPTALRLVQQVKQQGITLPLIGNIVFGTDPFLKDSGYSCADCVYPGLPTGELTPESIIKQYEASEGKINVSYQFARAAFQAFISLDEAIQSKEDPKAYLYKTRFTKPWLGSWSFDADGDIQGVEHALMQNGKILAQ